MERAGNERVCWLIDHHLDQRVEREIEHQAGHYLRKKEGRRTTGGQRLPGEKQQSIIYAGIRRFLDSWCTFIPIAAVKPIRIK
jgi:hypothetical protein